MACRFVGDWMPVKALQGMGDVPCIGNLESAFADGVVTSEKAYTSILPVACLAHVAMGEFAALSVANNHVYDAGKKGFDDLLA